MTEISPSPRDLTWSRQIVARCLELAVARAVLIGLAIGVAGCSRGNPEPTRERLLVAAASSLRELCEETGSAFRRDHPHVDLIFSFGASSKLARQMEATGEFDVLLSADAPTVAQILPSIDAGSVVPFLSNRIALVARAGLPDPVASLEDLLGRSGRIAVAAEPVPAGRYARELLDRRGLLERLQSRLVSADNVRVALAMVKSGATDYGLVYQSDARSAPSLGVCWIAPSLDGPKIEYVAATRSGARPAAAAYIRFMRGAAAQDVARRLGFEGSESSPRGAGDGSAPVMSSSAVLSVVGVTLKVGFVAVLLILIPGVALGFVLARFQFPGRSLVRVLVTLPMVLPPVAVGLLLMTLFARGSIVARAAETVLGHPLLLTWPAAAIAAAVMAFPLLVLGAQNAFLAVPRRVEQAAATLGATPGIVFVRVTLPLALRGILHGVVFAFARALGEFGATALVAGRIPGETETLSLAIYDRIERFADGEALMLSAISVVVALVFTGIAELALQRRGAVR